MKKILLVSNKVHHYRVSNYNYFTERFREEGWEFFVRANEMQKSNPYLPGFDFRELPFHFFQYKKEIERIKPDVVILFLHLKNSILWPLVHWLKMRRIPVVYWNKGINLEVRNPWFRNHFFYYIHSLCDALILYSRYEINDILPKNRHKIFVANNTINFNMFPDILQTKEEIKKEFGIHYQKVVLFVGAMRAVKKVEHLIEVFHTIDDPTLGCVLVGDAMNYDLPNMVKSRNIKYMGPLFDPDNLRVSKLFKMSDLFSIPGDVGLGLNEAFYWGLPVVTEAGLQPPEIHYLVSGRNGYIVPENNLEELKQKLLTLLRDDTLRSQFSANARQDILREANIEIMFQGFLDCITAVISGRLKHK